MNNEEKLFQPLKNITLSHEARTRMRAELSAYADSYTPAPVPVLSPYQHIFSFVGRYSFALAGAILVLTGGGVSYAAHNALPGGLLYGIKIGVLEPIEKIASPHETEVGWSVLLTQRRLTEAEMITDSESGELQAAFEVAEATRVAEKHLDASVSASANAEARNAFDNALSAHEKTLVRLEAVASTSARAHASTTAHTLNTVLTNVRARAAHSQKSAIPASPSRPTQPNKPAEMGSGNSKGQGSDGAGTPSSANDGSAGASSTTSASMGGTISVPAPDAPVSPIIPPLPNVSLPSL
jgi:hypothetical protein